MKIQYIKKYKKKVVKPIIVEDEDTGEKKTIMAKVPNPIFQKKANEKLGVMFADVQGDEILIGFCVAHSKMDKYDHVGKVIRGYNENGKSFPLRVLEKKDGLGVEIAKSRSEKWKEADDYMVKTGEIDTSALSAVSIPQTIEKPLLDFIQGCQNYYEGKNLVRWADLFVKDRVKAEAAEEKAI